MDSRNPSIAEQVTLMVARSDISRAVGAAVIEIRRGIEMSLSACKDIHEEVILCQLLLGTLNELGAPRQQASMEVIQRTIRESRGSK